MEQTYRQFFDIEALEKEKNDLDLRRKQLNQDAVDLDNRLRIFKSHEEQDALMKKKREKDPERQLYTTINKRQSKIVCAIKQHFLDKYKVDLPDRQSVARILIDHAENIFDSMDYTAAIKKELDFRKRRSDDADHESSFGDYGTDETQLML